jgi:hypothetical protein
LIEHLSVRAVELLKIIIRKSAVQQFKDIYLGEDEKLNKYAHANYSNIVSELFMEICEITSTFSLPWIHYNYSDEYREWVAHEYNESSVRKIVKLVKSSFEEFSQTDPLAMLSFIKNYDYSMSVISHEIIMCAIESLPTVYSNEAIQWLLCDFKDKVFVYTNDESNYLSCAKQIISKFSPICELGLFRQLEQAICVWKDDTEKMVNIFKNRLEINKRRQWEPVYYAYWGQFQKELLPAMDNLRLSTYSKELLEVLNRNRWIHSPFYHSGFLCGPAKSVVSPIDSYADRISDKSWLKITSTPNEKMKGHWSDKDNGPYYVEATHEMFSHTLAKQAKLQPARFAKLSLKFPINCYHGYVLSVINALINCGQESELVDIELVSSVLRRYAKNAERNIAVEIARVVEKRAEESWTEDIIDLLEDLALRHPEPATNEYAVTSSSDPDNLSPKSLLNNSINCVRGCVLHTIAALLWSHRELGERFKLTILCASSDLNDAVRFAVLFCIVPYYNFDSDFSVKVFRILLSADLRVIAAPGSWQILSRDYHNDSEFYEHILITACKSDIEELSCCAVGLVSAIAIFFGDVKMFCHLITEEYTPKQEEKICLQAASSFNQDVNHELSEKILLHFIDTSISELRGISKLFFNRSIIIQRDKDFLIHLMYSNQSVHQIHAFLEYLNELGEDIIEFADVLEAVGKGIVLAPKEKSNRLVVNDLIQCVIRLFDRGKDNLRIRNICLDIWDNLFKSSLQDIKPLSDMIDNFE